MKQVGLTDNWSSSHNRAEYVTSFIDSRLPDDCWISCDRVEHKIRELSESDIDRRVLATVLIFYHSERVYSELPTDHDASIFDLREQATNLILSGIEYGEINQELKRCFPKRPNRTPDWDWDTLRKKAYERDEYECRNCRAQGGKKGDTELHAHHIVPQSNGGNDRPSNLATLCRDCHERIHPHM